MYCFIYNCIWTVFLLMCLFHFHIAIRPLWPQSWLSNLTWLDLTSDAMTSRLPHYEAKCVQRRGFQWGPVPLRSDIKGTELPPASISMPLERQLIALQLCRWQFLYNETLQQTSCPLLSKFVWKFDPHFEEVRGGLESWLVARWKARIRLPIRHNSTFFSLALTVEALQGKTCRDSLLSGGG